jgi:hypothetical protein
MHSSHKEKINNDANGFVFKKGAPLMKVILLMMKKKKTQSMNFFYSIYIF